MPDDVDAPAPSCRGGARTRTSCSWRRARRHPGPCCPVSAAVSVRRPLIRMIWTSIQACISRWRTMASSIVPFALRDARRWCRARVSKRRWLGRGRRAALEAERGHGDLPPVVHAADDVLLRAAGVVEEHLVELGRAVGLHDRAHLDAGLLHRHEEVRDALVLRRVRVGAGEQEDVVGVLRLGRPDLLAVDHPLVAVEHGLGLQRREVGAGVRLAEALAPRDLALQDLAGGTAASAPRCPTAGSSGPTSVSPKKSARIGAPARANSSLSTTFSMIERPLPPYSFGHDAQIQPPS